MFSRLLVVVSFAWHCGGDVAAGLFIENLRSIIGNYPITRLWPEIGSVSEEFLIS